MTKEMAIEYLYKLSPSTSHEHLNDKQKIEEIEHLLKMWKLSEFPWEDVEHLFNTYPKILVNIVIFAYSEK